MNHSNAMKQLIALTLSAIFTFCLPILANAQTNAATDKLVLQAIHNYAGGSRWTNTWDMNQPMSTWHGVTLNAEGRVTALDLNNNGLSGIIPPEIGLLDKLTSLNLQFNQLGGTLPAQIWNLTNLQYLYLGDNQFTGTIPSTVANLINLQDINLRRNQLTGNIPPEFGQLTQLFALSLYGNKFSGTIPPELGNLSNLRDLWLFENNLTGEIPVELTQLSSLRQLLLSYNKLTGTIPPGLGSLQQLRYIELNDNRLSGNIPGEFTNIPFLRELRLNDNKFTGNIPNFSAQPTLVRLHIQNNKFSFNEIQATYYTNNNGREFQYSPQYHGKHDGYVRNAGATLPIYLSEPLPGGNTATYQWQRNGENIAGATANQYMISNVEQNTVGEYNLVVNYLNPSVPNMQVISEPIYVLIPGYDLYGQPTVENQIMMEFDNAEDRTFYEREFLNRNNGWVRDSCNCSRDLYLWQFPATTNTTQVLIDINTKVENQDTISNVDTGPNNICLLTNPPSNTTGWSVQGNPTGFQDDVKVFMLDTGLDTENWNASPYLMQDAPKDNCAPIASAAGYDYTNLLQPLTTNYMDDLGHGTFGFRSMTENLNTNRIKIIPLKVFNEDGEGILFDFVCALYHAIDHDADVINISAGYQGQPSKILENAIQLAQQKGIFIVTSSGNDALDINYNPQFPAHFSGEKYERINPDGSRENIPYDNVISVTSVDALGRISDFANYGNQRVTLAAYGEDMNGYAKNNSPVICSGTSVSAFHVTRELAVEISKNPNRTLQQIWADFEATKLTYAPSTFGKTKTSKRLNIQIGQQ